MPFPSQPILRKIAAAAAAVAATTAALGVAPAAAQSEPLATVNVVHGIDGTDLGADRDLPVDVSANGNCVLTGLTFGEIERLEVPGGTYDLAVHLADGSCGGAVAIAADGVVVPAGVNASVVAHLGPDGTPTAAVIVNDMSRPDGEYRTRVQVNHLAQAPAVDAAVTRTNRTDPFIHVAGAAFGDTAVAETWVGNYNVSIAPAGGDPIFEAGPVTFIANKLVAVYAVGSLETGSFTLLVDVQHLPK